MMFTMRNPARDAIVGRIIEQNHAFLSLFGSTFVAKMKMLDRMIALKETVLRNACANLEILGSLGKQGA